MPPVVRVQHTQRKYLYRALQRTQGSGGRSETVPQQAGPSADARIGGEGEWGKGSRGAGRARGRCTSQRDASGCERRWRYAPHLRPISSTFSKYPKYWSGSRRRDSGPEAEGRRLNRGLRAELSFLFGTPAGVQCLHYWQPFPRSSSNFTRAVHAHQPPYATRGCKRGVGPLGALQGARRTGAFERPEADQVHLAGARSPSSAGTPFAVTCGHLALF